MAGGISYYLWIKPEKEAAAARQVCLSEERMAVAPIKCTHGIAPQCAFWTLAAALHCMTPSATDASKKVSKTSAQLYKVLFMHRVAATAIDAGCAKGAREPRLLVRGSHQPHARYLPVERLPVNLKLAADTFKSECSPFGCRCDGQAWAPMI